MSEDEFDTPLEYRDRRAFLIISGIILVLVGCLLGLLSGLYVFLFGFADPAIFAGPPVLKPPVIVASVPGAAPAPAPAPALTPEEIFGEQMKTWLIAAGVIYGALGAVFIVVGAGNIFLKRWSRPLALILSACWTYMGLSMLVWTMVSFSSMREMMYAELDGAPGGAPPGMGLDAFMGIMIAVNLAMIFIFGIMLPATVFWLNRSRDAKATLEFCDKKPRWTDRCPVPVLGIAVVCGAYGLMGLGSAFWFPFMPVFGHFLTGSKAVLGILTISVILLFIAWGTYRLQIVGWALAMVLVIAGTLSAAVTFNKLDWMEMFEMMGIPVGTESAEEMERMMEAVYSGNSMLVGMVLAVLPILAYLVWAQRFFRKEDGAAFPAPAEGA